MNRRKRKTRTKKTKIGAIGIESEIEESGRVGSEIEESGRGSEIERFKSEIKRVESEKEGSKIESESEKEESKIDIGENR